jgi:hypothetical protein
MTGYEHSRPPFDPRWRAEFTPDPAQRFAAYGTASRASYARLLGSLATLDGPTAAEARVRLIQAHLAEVGQFRDFHGVAQ